MAEDVIEVPAMSARATRLEAGRTLRVIDVEGAQVADLVAFNAADPSEHLSQSFTRMNADAVRVPVGGHIYSSLSNPMLEIVDDPVGVHDLLYAPCNALFYERGFGIVGKTGCREHLSAALGDFGIGYEQVTDPFNVFMSTAIEESGRTVILPSPSRAGDHFEVRAEMDLIVGVSACAADVTDCNGGHCTGIRLVVER